MLLFACIIVSFLSLNIYFVFLSHWMLFFVRFVSELMFHHARLNHTSFFILFDNISAPNLRDLWLFCSVFFVFLVCFFFLFLCTTNSDVVIFYLSCWACFFPFQIDFMCWFIRFYLNLWSEFLEMVSSWDTIPLQYWKENLFEILQSMKFTNNNINFNFFSQLMPLKRLIQDASFLLKWM